MLKKKQWIKEFKNILIKEQVPAYNRGIMLTWIRLSYSYKTLTPRESVNECIDFQYGDPNGPDFAL